MFRRPGGVPFLPHRVGRLSLILLLVCALGLFFQTRARGEEPLVLDLPQLIRMAVARSPEVGEAQSEVHAAASDLEQARGAHYPQVETTVLAGPVPDAKEPEIRNNRIVDPSPAISLSRIGIFGRLDLTVTQPLYTFGKISNRQEAASRGVRATEFKVVEKKREIALRVKQLYFALILARAGREAVREGEAFFADAQQRIRRLLDLGSPNVTESDLHRVDVYQADLLRAKAEAEKGAQFSYFALKSMIRLPAGQEFAPAKKELPREAAELEALETYIQKALANRPELKQLAEALAARDYQVRATRSDRYPSFFASLIGSLAGAPGREALYNRYIPDEFNHVYAGVLAGIRWNFDFGISRAREDRMRAEYAKLTHARASAQMNIPLQVAQLYQEVREWKEAVEAYRRAAGASRRWTVAALADFDMGLGSADEMLRAIEKYGYHQGKYLEGIFQYHLARAKLEDAAGLEDW